MPDTHSDSTLVLESSTVKKTECKVFLLLVSHIPRNTEFVMFSLYPSTLSCYVCVTPQSVPVVPQGVAVWTVLLYQTTLLGPHIICRVVNNRADTAPIAWVITAPNGATCFSHSLLPRIFFKLSRLCHTDAHARVCSTCLSRRVSDEDICSQLSY